MVEEWQVEIIEAVTGAIVLGACQGFNQWQHRTLKSDNAKTQALVALTFADVATDLDAIRQAVENLTVKINGGDRRAPRTSNNLAGTGDQRRWTDPTTSRPTTTT